MAEESAWDKMMHRLEDLDSTVKRKGKQFLHGAEERWTGAYFPVDVEDLDNKVHIQMDLPGIAKKDVLLRADENSLTVAGERACPETLKHKTFHSHHERPCGPFKRTIYIPGNARVDEIKASFQEGVLDVNIPKGTESRHPTKYVSVQ